MPQFVLTFGGGINARKRVADIALDECVPPSENFDLDPQHRALNRRKPFDLIATTPNASSIEGMGQLIKQDGTVSTVIQSGDTVYSWDGDQSFTSVGTVSSSAKLRGPREHNFTLDQYVILTDLEKQETVKKWDGTTFQDLAHDLGGNFFAKYCRVHNERAIFGNVTSGTDTPHVILASAIGDAEDLTTADRPASSLGFDAAWFLPLPDLRPINGLESAFGEFLISTDRGRLFRLAGSDATDFVLQEFHTGSAVVGSEAIKNIGNDVIMGLAGRIESLSGTLNFGDVEANDLSLPISPLIENVTNWTIEYDRRMQKVYCFPSNQSAVWVLHKKMLNDPESQGLSPWAKWITDHSTNFSPTVVMQLVNPLDSTDAVYFGDENGNIYRLDGEGSQDAASDNVVVKRTSGLVQVPEGNTFDIRGRIDYRKLFETDVTIKVLAGGTAVFDQSITLTMPSTSNDTIGFYGGNYFYDPSGDTVYGVGFSGRIHRQGFALAGHESYFQIEVTVDSANEFDIEQILFSFETAND